MTKKTETDKPLTRSLQVASEVASLLKARTPLLWIVSREEARVEGYLMEAAAAAGYITRTWDVGQGVCDFQGKQLREIGDADPDATLAAIAARATPLNQYSKADRCAWIMRDLPAWISGPAGAKTCRNVRNLARLLPGTEPDRSQSLIILSPDGNVPAELAGHATVIEWPLPDRTEIGEMLDALQEQYPDFDVARNGKRDAAIDAAVGLSGEEAQSCYSRSMVTLKRVDPLLVTQEKKRVIAREKILEWVDPIKGGLDAVGGLENLKAWLLARSTGYGPRARAYGLPTPKGVLLVGVAGCGKTLTAKAFPTALGCPLLRLDLGAMKSKFVGESEANLRKAFRIIEAIGRCVVWIDEVEKSLQGATSGSADGGVSSDALGALLTWMQERQSEAFVIATANDVTSLPPELLRKGRFDEIFSIDLPNLTERKAVLAATLKSYGRDPKTVDLQRVALECAEFTGSEIATLVPEALIVGFAEGEREPTTDDLMVAARNITPLSKTAPEKIEALRKWVKGKARPATMEESAPTTKRVVRALDLS